MLTAHGCRWAVGVLTYEMRCGHSPFEARSQMDMFKKITRRDFEYPRDFTPEEQQFIGGLLQVDLTRRLGNMHGGVDDIRSQPYFAGCVVVLCGVVGGFCLFVCH